MSPSRSTTTRNRISLESGAGVSRSPVGFIGAVAIHAAIIAAALFTWEHRLDISQESAPVVPVDLVTLGEKTNITPAVRPAPRIAPEEPQVQLQPDKLIVPPPAIDQEQTEAAPQPQPAPSEPVVQAPPPPAVPKVKPQPQPDTKKSFNVDNVLALLNKVAPSASPNTRTAPRTRQGFGAQNAMTADLVDLLRSQIQQCWSPPVGAPNPEQLIVQFHLFLNPDGSVAQPPQLTADSAAAVARNPFTRAAADAAERAIYTCAPYKLPADRYAQWREINPMIFDPRQMVGQ